MGRAKSFTPRRRSQVRRSTHRWVGILAFITSAVTATPWVRAQNLDENLIVRRTAPSGHATFVKVEHAAARPASVATRRSPTAPWEFLHRHGPLFGLSDPTGQLLPDPLRTTTDRLGHAHAAYNQVHEGIPVFSGIIRVHEDAVGRIIAANGHIHPIPAKLNKHPSITATDALRMAEARMQIVGSLVEHSELVIVDPGWYGDASRGAHLAYHLILSDADADLREAFVVDAHDGEILDQWSLLHTARIRKVFNGNGTTILPGPFFPFPARAEGDPPFPSPPNPADINRAYDYAGDTYDYFSRAFGRDGLNDLGMDIILTVNSIALSCPNARWNGVQAIFCNDAASDDVTAHELTHAITQFTANLIYQNQSGQLNESFSDVFGELVDLFNGDAAFAGIPGGTPWPAGADYGGEGTDAPNRKRSGLCSSASNNYQDGVRWMIGEDATAFSTAIRDMWHPTCLGDPDRANHPDQTCNPLDNGGVHGGSGVPNHAFAILTDGKTFNGQTVTGIGPIKAGAVWYRALTTYLEPAADFADAYEAFNQAAADLIGTIPNDPRTGLPSSSAFTAADAAQVEKALIAVEMDTNGACGASVDVLNSAPPAQCDPRFALFHDDFEQGIGQWTVSNTGPPQPYDWVQTTDLPFQRPGTAWYGADPDLGNCTTDNESAVHSLFSPVIQLPLALFSPTLVFTHYLAVEPGWDGGNLQFRRNGGAWQPLPTSALSYNPYNATINSDALGNTNPLAGQPGFTGAGGRWGTSLVDLSSLASGGDSLQIRFDFGKDGCTGVDGWYLDDIEVYTCGCSFDAQCNDGDPCTQDGCQSGQCVRSPAPCGNIILSDPPSGAIDARQPHQLNDPNARFGWQSVDITFDQDTSKALSTTDFEVATVGGISPPPTVLGVLHLTLDTVRVELSAPIESGAWTTIKPIFSDPMICLGFLPGDVNGNRLTNAQDVISLIDALNQIPGSASALYATDIDRSGLTAALDIARLIDLLNGATELSPWLAEQLPESPCN